MELHSKDPTDQKKEIRNRIRRLRDSLSMEEIDSKSQIIQNRLWQLIKERECKTVMFYVAFGSEVRTQECISQCIKDKITVVVPVCSMDKSRKIIPSLLLDPLLELAKSKFGIPEPKPEFLRPFPPERIDLVIVPGIAFDEKGYRIGYGGGYYDRFLKLCHQASSVALQFVGLAYEMQMVKSALPASWDMPVHKIITEFRP